MLVLLANIEAVDGSELDLVAFDLADAVDHARRPDLAEEAEMQLLQFHVLLGLLAVCSIFEGGHQMLLDERLDLVMLFAKHGVQELELLFGVTIQRIEDLLLVVAEELIHQLKRLLLIYFHERGKAIYYLTSKLLFLL